MVSSYTIARSILVCVQMESFYINHNVCIPCNNTHEWWSPAGLSPLSEAVGIVKDSGRVAADLTGLSRNLDESELMLQVR